MNKRRFASKHANCHDPVQCSGDTDGRVVQPLVPAATGLRHRAIESTGMA